MSSPPHVLSVCWCQQSACVLRADPALLCSLCLSILLSPAHFSVIPRDSQKTLQTSPGFCSLSNPVVEMTAAFFLIRQLLPLPLLISCQWLETKSVAVSILGDFWLCSYSFQFSSSTLDLLFFEHYCYLWILKIILNFPFSSPNSIWSSPISATF